jgi:hypothetical protein
VVSSLRSARRHPLALATAALFAVLIAMPFTAPFSSCGPTVLFSPASEAIPAARTTSAIPTVVGRDQTSDHAPRDVGILAEDQFKDEAAIVDASVEETTVSSTGIVVPRASATSVTRTISSVLRL